MSFGRLGFEIFCLGKVGLFPVGGTVTVCE